jgi:hypothetical protein
MKNTHFIFYALLALFTLAWAGCSNDPDVAARNLGLGLVSPEDLLKVDSLSITANADTNFLSHVNTSSSVLFGKCRDIQVRALMQFTGFSSIPASATVDSAVVTIKRNYSYLDSSGQLAFAVHELLSGWNDLTFTWDSSLAPGVYNSTPETSVLGPITADDTTISFRIDQLVRRWVQSSTNSPNGIILLPDLNNADLITGAVAVSGLDNRPLLVVSYRDSLDSVRTLSVNSFQSEFVGAAAFTPLPGSLLLQAGLSERALLRFDSISIPPRVSITQALLQLSTDGTQDLLNSYSRDSILVYLSRKNVPPYDSLVLGTFCNPVTAAGEKIYQADIRTIVQLWVTREPNNGLVIRPYAEVSSFDRFVIYGASARAGLKPRLIIKYSILP